MKLQKSHLSDLPEIVECHKDAFPSALSSKHGSTFISKMMEWYITSDRGVLFHVNDDKGEMAGYCGGIVTRKPGLLGAVSSISQYAFYDFLESYLRKPWLLVHPENLKKFSYIVKNSLIKFGLKKTVMRVSTKDDADFQAFMGLVVIGVKNKYHGKGYGSALLQEFERIAIEDRGIKRIQLSVKASNSKAIKSYLRNGWYVSKQDDQTKQLSKEI
jgi:ribosomal protein S18 acetylase RimI-like enzyme